MRKYWLYIVQAVSLVLFWVVYKIGSGYLEMMQSNNAQGFDAFLSGNRLEMQAFSRQSELLIPIINRYELLLIACMIVFVVSTGPVFMPRLRAIMREL